VLLEALWLLFPVAALVGLLAAWKRRRLVLATTLGLLLAFFALAYAAKEADFRDADGWIDCWPSCSALQVATGVGVTYVPVGGLLLAAATIVLALVRRT
jgi:hypothetical protein